MTCSWKWTLPWNLSSSTNLCYRISCQSVLCLDHLMLLLALGFLFARSLGCSRYPLWLPPTTRSVYVLPKRPPTTRSDPGGYTPASHFTPLCSLAPTTPRTPWSCCVVYNAQKDQQHNQPFLVENRHSCCKDFCSSSCCKEIISPLLPKWGPLLLHRQVRGQFLAWPSLLDSAMNPRCLSRLSLRVTFSCRFLQASVSPASLNSSTTDFLTLHFDI